ncbi:hypothetical protein JXB28_06435 [Candidatus Woesearchaeota archaeon]|nr:hypothetical protein [Candidatus Woesearchaeota archaeon]
MKEKLMALFVVSLLAMTMVIAAGMQEGPPEGSGDGIPDEWGLEDPFLHQNGLLDGICPGPAPNAGDGIPDGSGW